MTSLAQFAPELYTGEPTHNLSQLTAQVLFDDYAVTIESEANKFMLPLLCIVSWRGEKWTCTHKMSRPQ